MNLMNAPRLVLYDVKCDQSPWGGSPKAAPKGQVVEAPLGGHGPPRETHAPTATALWGGGAVACGAPGAHWAMPGPHGWGHSPLYAQERALGPCRRRYGTHGPLRARGCSTQAFPGPCALREGLTASLRR